MDEIKDPNDWIEIGDSDISDLDSSSEKNSIQNQQANEDSQSVNQDKHNANEDKDIYLGNQLNDHNKSKEISQNEQYIKQSFGYQENNLTGSHYNPFLSPYVDDYVQKNNYEPQSSQLNSNLGHSIIEQKSYNQLEQSLHKSCFLNTSILRFEQQQGGFLENSQLPEFMAKSHIDQLNRGNQTISFQKKKTEYQINISSFQKIQNQQTSYVVYIINSNWSDNSQEIKPTVKRRFNEFKNLYQYISKKYMGNVQPSFPSPTIQETILPVIKFIKDDQNYLEDRQKKLETYLKKLAQCDFILGDDVFEKFLGCQEEFDEKLFDKKEYIQQYFTTMLLNFKSLIYQQQVPYLSNKDQDHQDQLKSLIKQIQEQKNILIQLINEFKKNKYEELEQYLKNGQNAAETEITQLDYPNMNFQQNFLSEFYKKYSIQSEINIICQLSSFLEEIIDQFNDAEKSYENFMIERNKLVQQQLSKEKDIDQADTENDENKPSNQQDTQINQLQYMMENTHIKIIKADDNDYSKELQQDNSDNENNLKYLNEQQGKLFSQIIITKDSLFYFGKNLIQEFSILLTIKYPSKLAEFKQKMRLYYLNHYEQEIQLYQETLDPLLYQ
ncbi:hypothetical protein ABPG74_005699 [Tetrahymena malaccensis]